MNILIVGAGPTGLTTAIELARQGVIATLVDRRDSASTFSRAVGITPRSLELLAPSGVAERLIDEGVAMDGLRIYRGDRMAMSMPMHSDRSFFHTMLALPQDRTETHMADVFRSLGGDVQYDLALESMHLEGNRVRARFSDDSEQLFDTVVGADGVRSTVREQSGIEYPGFDLQQEWSIADVDVADWPHPSSLTMLQVEPVTIMVVVPIGPERYRMVASHERALSVVPLSLNVTRIRREGSFRISIRQAAEYSRGPIHLAGDAAHCHSPVGGRGMNLGIGDAVSLAASLIDNRISDYATRRHREGAAAIAVTERGRKMASGHSWWRRMVFRVLLGTLNLLPPLKRRLGRFLVEF